MGLLRQIRIYRFCFLLTDLWMCWSMTTSRMRTVGELSSLSNSCDEHLLPEAPTCQAAFLPNVSLLSDQGHEQGMEVEMVCSWAHEYPVQHVRFKHGFDIIEPQLELTKNMTIISRRIFQASEWELRVAGFLCEFSFLHPLCGPRVEQSPCSIVTAAVRLDPLYQEVGIDGSAKVYCHRRTTIADEDKDITWKMQKFQQNRFFPFTNGSRRTISDDETFITWSPIRASDNLTLIACEVGGSAGDKTYGITQIRVVDGIETTSLEPSTAFPSTHHSTTPPATIPTAISSTDGLPPKTERVINTNTPDGDPTSIIVTNSTNKVSLFENIYFIILIVLMPVILFFGICVIILMVRYRRTKKFSSNHSPAPAVNHTINDNMYEYEPNDNRLEHEYLQSCIADDTTSQHTEYVNDRMLHGGKSGRTTRILRSRSDSRLAQMAEGIPLKDLPKSQSAWALPGLSVESAILDRPMPDMPGRKRSMTASATVRPPLPRGAPPHRFQETQEYATIDDGMLSRSLDMSHPSDAQPYACTQLHPRSQTMDAKIFIPKRKQKK